jgi:hypothetical protein
MMMSRENQEQKVFKVTAHSRHDYLRTEDLGIFSTREKAEAWVAQVEMPQRECLEIHEWSLDDPTDDVFWQAGYKPEPPISDEERLRWMAANAAEDAERKAKEAGQSFDRDKFIAEYRADMLRRCADAEAAAAERANQRPKWLAGTTSSPANTDGKSEK